MRTIVIAILFATSVLATGQNIEYPVMRYDTLLRVLDPYMGYDPKTLENRGFIEVHFENTECLEVDFMDADEWLKEKLPISVGYLSFSPEDNGMGFRIDKDGGYMSMQYGNYKLPYGGYIKDHTKIAMGFVYRSYSLGLAYHEYGEMKVPDNITLTRATLRPISVEAGVRVFVTQWFVAALRYDVLRREGTVEFGINLDKIN